MTTEFGKVLRKIRVDRDMTLADLADLLSVSAAFLSALETGKKPVPPTFVSKLTAALDLTGEVATSLSETAAKSRSKAVVIPLDGKDAFSKRLAVAFARRLDNMPSREVQELLKLLEADQKIKKKREDS